jgi:GntR family transcriptional regulator, rspAB operon transcriptional repressor
VKTGVSVSAPSGEAGLAAQAYAQLREAILEGRLPPGTPLSRRRLAGDYGMSPVPVGDAISRLETEGLVESRPRAGTRVRIASPEEVHGNYVLREALETHSARLFAESASAAARKRVLGAAQRLDAAYSALAASPDYSASQHARVERGHNDFHMLIARATRIPVLNDAIERSRVLLFNWIFTLTRDLSHFPDRWHGDLAAVLANGIPEAAAEAMRAHVRFRQAEVIRRVQALSRHGSGGPRMVRGPRPGKA